MKLADFFEKDINRSIETVIKADDRDHILEEVKEYVVTREVTNKIGDFFAEYIDYQNSNGVWISGFFGSGKSHLLKILSYVLEDREEEGQRLGKIFADKIEGDELLKNDILKATRIPSESVLFNIDQQAQITTKKDEDAILNVFYKVLNDHMGYFGSQRHVAEFERWLDNEDNFEVFQSEYEVIGGEPWSKARRKYFSPKVKKAVGEVLGALFNDEASQYTGLIDELRKTGSASIEHFCELVNEYLDTKPEGFRLNFFVDEVGQYISDNTKLMLNLQTIAETLATKTEGRSWVLVTSQEDIERVVGDLGKKQQNDFSRIQARFKIKLNLTSKNVDEVIEKRLLSKKQPAQKLLRQVWDDEGANMPTLFNFDKGGIQFTQYRDADDFVRKFPFVPYQFDLFQECIKALSIHNAFQGKHASVGERSMLGVFQEVVKKMQDQKEDSLVSFDLLYDGISSTIRSEIQGAINLADKNVTDAYARKVLRALFLVKYYPNFKTTLRNVAVLMMDNLHIDLKAHEKKVQQALNLLENQTYIQRSGEIYEFLTDDEKDIEREIKNTDYDSTEVTSLLTRILFDELIKVNRIPFEDNKQLYEFTQQVDGTPRGRAKELTVEIITPNFDDYEAGDRLKSRAMANNRHLILVLPNDDRLLKDLIMYIKTTKYTKQNNKTSNKPVVKRILAEKGQQNTSRYKNLTLLLDKLLSEAEVYLASGGGERGKTTDGKTKVFAAFQDLIRQAYTNLKMIGKNPISEETVKNTLFAPANTLFNNDDATLSEAEQEVLSYLRRKQKQTERTSLAALKEHFSGKSYGWYPNAIWNQVARLHKRGKIVIKRDTDQLDDDGVYDALFNNRLHGGTLVEPQQEIDPKTVKKLKNTYQEAFDEACAEREAKEVAQAFQQQIKNMYEEVRDLLANKRDYPFLKNLETGAEFLKVLRNKEYTYFPLQLSEYEDTLLDFKEDHLDPIRRFWNGEQKNIFDSLSTFINGNTANLEYIEGDELNTLQKVYKDPKPYIGTQIRDAKSAMESLSHKVKERLDKEKALTLSDIESARTLLEKEPEFPKLESIHRERLVRPFVEELEKAKTQRYIANLRQARDRVENVLFPRQLNELHRLATPPEPPAPEPPTPKPGDPDGPKGGTPQPTPKPTPPQPPTPKYVARRSITVNFEKKQLHTAADVEAYVASLKAAYLKAIEENKRIVL